MSRARKQELVAADEHDNFFAMTLAKLQAASEDARIMGRLFRIDVADRESAHLGAVLQFLAEFATENEYATRDLVSQLKDAIAEARAERAEREGDEVEEEEEDQDEEDQDDED